MLSLLHYFFDMISFQGLGQKSWKQFCWFFQKIWRHQMDILKSTDKRTNHEEDFFKFFVLLKKSKLSIHSLPLKLYNVLSFYRSQNVLCQSKFFESAQKFDLIKCLFKNFCASIKKLKNPMLLNANHLLVCHNMVTGAMCK